jgi:hypothetical protein
MQPPDRPRSPEARYDVTFREFAGGHELPEAIAREGLAWLAQSANHSA